jgi:hypothetical protein
MRRSPRLKIKKAQGNNEEIQEEGSQPSALVAHRTVNSTCLVCIGMSGVQPDNLSRESATRDSRGCSTELSGVHQKI